MLRISIRPFLSFSESHPKETARFTNGRSTMSSGFISEVELAEQRRIRQEEWERVRTADQPLELPEEPYDSRSLYERLQEQKNKRDAEYEEAHKLKNMIKGLDDDEVEFLDLVDRTKLEEERKKHMEEEKEMRDFKAAVASLQEKSLDKKLKQELKKPQTATGKCSSSGRNSQLKLLAGVVVKRATSGCKRTSGEGPTKSLKRKQSLEKEEEKQGEDNEEVAAVEEELSVEEKQDEVRVREREEEQKEKGCHGSGKTETGNVGEESRKRTRFGVPQQSQDVGLKCIGILPGLGSYKDSSDSDCSSDTDQDPELNQSRYDLLGRKIEILNEKEKS